MIDTTGPVIKTVVRRSTGTTSTNHPTWTEMGTITNIAATIGQLPIVEETNMTVIEEKPEVIQVEDYLHH